MMLRRYHDTPEPAPDTEPDTEGAPQAKKAAGRSTSKKGE